MRERARGKVGAAGYLRRVSDHYRPPYTTESVIGGPRDLPDSHANQPIYSVDGQPIRLTPLLLSINAYRTLS